MTEALVRKIREVAGDDGPSVADVERLLFHSSGLEVWVDGDLKDRDVHLSGGDLCLVLGHVAESRSAKSVREEYRRHGAAGVAALDGHFVAVLYDSAEDAVSVIHDKAGIRHAYYWSQGGDFTLSTKLTWLMDASSLDGRAPQPTLSRQGLASYMAFQYVPTPHTMFEDVYQLPPGTELVKRRDEPVSVRQHVEFPEPGARALEGTTEEHGERIADLLSESMAEQMDNGGKIGAMLSGGFDTSANVALMVERLGIRPLTFTAAFREPGYDEAEFAKAVADHYDLEHVAVEIEPRLQDMLPDVVKSFDSPNADQAVFAEYFLCNVASDHGCGSFVTGEGGDEILGYPRADSEGVDFQNLPEDNGELARMYFEQTYLSPPEIRTELLSRLGMDSATPYEYLGSLYQSFSDSAPFERLYYGQWRTWLLDGVYMKDNQVAKHFDLSPVFPFMDTRLMEYMSHLSLSQKLSGLNEKAFLESALADRVPRLILEREKHKFWLPFAKWFRAEARDYLRDTLLASQSFVADYFGYDTLERLANEHDTGAADHSRLLWAFLFLEVWLQEHASRWINRNEQSSATVGGPHSASTQYGTR